MNAELLRQLREARAAVLDAHDAYMEAEERYAAAVRDLARVERALLLDARDAS